MLAKRQRWRDKMVMSSVTPITIIPESPPKPTATIPKGEGPMEELIKDMRDLSSQDRCNTENERDMH